MVTIHNDWKPLLEPEFDKPYFRKLRQYLEEEYRSMTIYPDMDHLFHALHLTSYTDVRVVLIGQDPYHGPGQAHGLSFSVLPGVPVPPSLHNMFRELSDDLGCRIPNHGCLLSWAQQGVLLLNSVLTVRSGQPHSHQGLGWETFTDKVIEIINLRPDPAVFLLWGNRAQTKRRLIDETRHAVICTPHPSPLSAYRGFFGSRPFSRANRALRQWGREEVNWQIPDFIPSEHSVVSIGR